MSFADATVEVTADWSKVDNQLAAGLGKAATDAGRAARPAWAAAGRAAGDTYFDAAAGRWRDSRGRFIAAGVGAGRAFGTGFKLGTRDMFGNLASAAKAAAAGIGKGILAGGAVLGVSLLTEAVGGLGVAALALVSQLAPLMSLVALLPGLALGGAAAIATLVIGFHGMGDAISAGLAGDTEKFNEALKKLSPAAAAVAKTVVGLKAQFTALRNAVQQNLFAGVAAQLKTLATALLPTATRELSLFAAVFNTAFHQFAAVATTATFVGQLSAALHSAALGLGNMAVAVAPLTAAFGALAAVTAPFIARLGGALGELGLKLADFLTRISASGQLAAALERAFTVASQLGAILGNLGRIFFNVFASAGAAGGDMLAGLVQITAALADMTKGGALTPLFTGLAANLGVVMRVLGAFVKALAPVAGVVSDSIGRLAGPLVALMDALGVGLAALAPAFVPFTTFLIAVGQAIEPLLPMAGALVNALVSVLAVGLTPMIAVLGTVLKLIEPFTTAMSLGFAQVAQTVLPVVMSVASALATSLAPVFVKIMEALAPFLPAITEMATIFAGRLVTALPGLTDAFIKLATALGEIVDKMGENLLTVLTDMAPKIPEIADAFVRWALAVADMVVAFLPFLPLLLGTKGGALDMVSMLDAMIFALGVAASVATFFADAFRSITAVIAFVSGVFDAVGDTISDVWTTITDAIGDFLEFIGAVPDKVGQFLSGLPDVIGDIIDRAVEFFTGLRDRVVEVLNQLPEKIGTMIGELLVFFIELPGKIGEFLATLPEIVGGIIDSVVKWFTDLPGRVVAAAVDLWNGLVQLFEGLRSWWIAFVIRMVDKVVEFFTGLPDRIIGAITGLIDSISTWADNLFSTIGDKISSGVDTMVEFFSNLPGRIMSALSNFGMDAWNGLKSFVNSGIDIINRMIKAANVPLSAAGISTIPTIPHLAQGIFATRPMLAVIAEEAPEVVIPMAPSRRSRALALAQQSGLTALLAASGVLRAVPAQRQNAVAQVTNNVTVNSAARDPETVATKVVGRIARLVAVT